MALTKIGTDGVKDDAVTSGKIPANAVGSSELADNAVDTNAIQDEAVTTNKIADNAVTFQQLSSNTVKTGNIEGGAIITDRIADQAVTLDKLPHGTSSNDGKFLRANNGADPSFETVSIPAGTTINNNADKRVITGDANANTLNAEGNVFVGSGKIGVGTSNPSDLVHLSESGATNNYIRFSNSNISNGWSVGAQSGGRFQIVHNGVRDAFYIDTGNKSEEFVLQKALKFIKSF